MPRITKNFIIDRKGTGRGDYSLNIEESTVPFIRSHQLRAVGYGTYDLTPFSWVTIDLEPILGFIVIYPGAHIRSGYNYIAYSYTLEFAGNELIKAYFGDYNIATDTFVAKQCKYGYGKVEFKFPKGYFVSKDTLAAGIQPSIGFLPGGYWMKESMSYLSEELA